jgi:alpha-1,3-mannosyl-glycoprotein beta-1,2-N-acetylglucosaminyltransferase
MYKGYYMIARHYKLALKHVFETLNFGAVIITEGKNLHIDERVKKMRLEDDLDIAEDFFEYFGATRALLDSDRSLICVSAWNDNGKANLIDTNSSGQLYRSDFFPGLGWMLTRRLWDELSPGWPDGFWDDWLRDPPRRQKRSCIRPEISRTSMTDHGKEGASKSVPIHCILPLNDACRGLFFSKHLIKIKLSDRPFPFMQTNLSYLLKENYDTHFIDFVYASKEVTIAQLRDRTSLTGSKTPEALRLTYNSADEFIAIASELGLMGDFKVNLDSFFRCANWCL